MGKLDTLELIKILLGINLENIKINIQIILEIFLYINKFNEFFNNHKPDLIFLLGDRYETLGIAVMLLQFY